MNLPLLVIGVDAASWDVIHPLLGMGALPNIARLIDDGTSMPLRSFTQYLSPALWMTISTGTMPETHGVHDFYSATRRHLKYSTFYDILGGPGGKIGLFRWFASSPYEENRGFTVPEYTAQFHETFPPKLQFVNDLARPTGLKSYLRGGWGFLKHGGAPSTMLAAARQVLSESLARPEHLESWYQRGLLEPQIYADIFTHLLKKYALSCAAILFTIIDALGHVYWKYRQPDLFAGVSESEIRKYGDVIDKAYIAVDQAVGKILGVISDETLVVLVSDHGQQAGDIVKLPYLISQSIVRKLGLPGEYWITHLSERTLFRPKSGENGDEMLHQLQQKIESVKTIGSGEPAFEIVELDPPNLQVRVALDRHTVEEALVSDGAGVEMKLTDILHTNTVSGAHAQYGVLILSGPGVPRGLRLDEDATILDVAPTILALQDHPVAEDMQGQIIPGLIQPDFLEHHPLRSVPSYARTKREPTPEDKDHWDAESREKMEERLRQLGYLE